EIMVIPRLSERLTCMIFRRRFEIEAEELLPDISILRDAHMELKNSEKFKKLLKTVLAIGNYLNGSSFRGNAYGFQLNALLNMGDTKAAENNTKGAATLLHYLAVTLEENQKELVNFMDELPHLEPAARVSVVTVMASVNNWATGVSHIREEIHALDKIKILPNNDRFVEEFVEFIEPTVTKIRDMAKKLDNELKQLLLYYGEDPSSTKPEDFFKLIVSFASYFAKARKENEELQKKAEKERERERNRLVNRRPSDTSSVSSSIAGKGEFDDAIRELRSGLRRGRGRPVSKVFMDAQAEEPSTENF
ncbi:9760_t:CDS:2, partial [Ambispora gerdemannii]